MIIFIFQTMREPWNSYLEKQNMAIQKHTHYLHYFGHSPRYFHFHAGNEHSVALEEGRISGQDDFKRSLFDQLDLVGLVQHLETCKSGGRDRVSLELTLLQRHMLFSTVNMDIFACINLSKLTENSMGLIHVFDVIAYNWHEK